MVYRYVLSVCKIHPCMSARKNKNEARNFHSFVGKLLLLCWTQSRPFTLSPDQRDNPAGGGNSINKSEHGCPGLANHTTIFNIKTSVLHILTRHRGSAEGCYFWAHS